MNHNFKFDDVNQALPLLLHSLLTDGTEFGSRDNKRTRELMHVGITLTKPWQREIVLPDRKASIAAQVVETMWVLSGRTDIAVLTPYLPRAADFSDDGIEWRAGYGARLRNYHGVDQLAYLVDTMKNSPGSRQAVATLWDPTVDTEPGKDIACNNWLSFSSRLGYLDLHVGVRSNDVMWGWSGINAFEWSVLLEIVAGMSGLHMGSLHFSTTSLHMYDQHWKKAARIRDRGNDSTKSYAQSPRFSEVSTLAWFDELAELWFTCENDIRNGWPVDVAAFPEPMMRSWLHVLRWHWTQDVTCLDPISGTRLAESVLSGYTPPAQRSPEDFLAYVNALHTEKHLAYGDSWKRRGESGILANIARKVDRLESGVDTSDETQTDTAVDLFVYTCKYLCWLRGSSGDPADVMALIDEVKIVGLGLPERITADFDYLCTLEAGPDKFRCATRLAQRALGLAWSLWG